MKNNAEEKKEKKKEFKKTKIFKMHWYNNGDKISEIVKKQ